MSDATLAIIGPILMGVLFIMLIAALLFGEQFGEWLRDAMAHEMDAVNGPPKFAARSVNCTVCRADLTASGAISLHEHGKVPRYFCCSCRGSTG